MAENRPSHLLHSPITPIKFDRALKEIPSSVTPSNKPSRLGSVRDSDDKSPQKVIIRNSMKSSFLRTGNALRSVHKSSKDVSNTHTENKSLPDDRSSTYIPNSPSSVSVSSDSSLSTITREFDKVKVKSPSIARVNWDTSDDEQDVKSKQSESTIDVNNHSPLPQRTRTNNALKRKRPPTIKRYIESDESDSSEREDVSNNSPADRKISKVIIKRPRSHSVNNDKADISEHLLNSDLEHKVDKLQASFPHAPRSDIVRALLRANGAQVKAASELIMNQYLKPSSVKSSTGGKASSAQNLSDRPPEVKKAQRVAPVIVRAEPEQPRAGTNIRVTPRVSNVLSTSSKKQRKSVIMISDESEEEAMTSDDESSDRQYDVDFAPDIEQVKLDLKVVEFFNTSSCQDIQDVTACSIEQAETLISELRPFEDMEDLQEKLRSTKGLGERIITAYKDMMQGYSAVDKLVTDIEHIGKELGEIVSVWKKKEANQDAMSEASGELDMSAMEGYLHQQPETMSNEIVLKGYQIFGVNWMLLLYRRKLSGILADEMGLGKTAQVIGFIAQLVSEGKVGPHLIIVPSSTLENWLREFEKFCPSLDVRSYYGTQNERRAIRYDLREDRSWPVLVTTYQMATGTEIDRKFLKKFNFDVTVLDEGHMVKNCTSARYHHLMSIPSSFRLLLTGTPLQNNLQELVSLLTFILPKMFTENEEELKKIFKIKYTSSTIKDRDASNASESKAPAGSTNIAQMLSMQRIKRAKKMMTPFVLRRQKSQVYNDLPKKHHMIKRCPMSERQLQVYTKVVDDSKKSWITPESNGDASTITSDSGTENAPAIKPAKTANILMELRKAAIHPMLLRSMYTDEIIGKMAKSIMREEQFWNSEEQFIFEDMSVMTDFELHKLCLAHRSIREYALSSDMVMDSGKVQVLKELLIEMKGKGDRVLVFSQFTMMLDVLEEVLSHIGLKYSRLDGASKVDTRQDLIDEFSEDPEITVFLLSTKAGGFGINLTAANVVILYDLDPNPHNDKQAEDRAHRVGQVKDVTVIRLISENTVEENIHQMAEVKLRLDQSVSFNRDDAADEDHGSEDSSDANMSSLVKSALHM